MNKPKSIVKSPKDLKERTRIISTAMPSSPESTETEKLTNLLGKEKKLELDTNSVKPQKTRTEHYQDLEKQRIQDLGDEIEYASWPKRVIAGVIDFSLIGSGCYYLIRNYPQLQVNLFKLPLKNTIASWYIAYLLVAIVVSVMPLIFFQKTLGKAIAGIRLRGMSLFTLNPFQVIGRELFVRPICLITMASIYTATQSSKNKLTLHDLICRTRVIRD